MIRNQRCMQEGIMLVSGVSYRQQGNKQKINFTSKSQVVKKTAQAVFNPKKKPISRKLFEIMFGPVKEPRLEIPERGFVENLTLSPKTLFRFKGGAFFGESSVFNGICISPKNNFFDDALATEKSRFIGNSFTLSGSSVLDGSVKGKSFYGIAMPKRKRGYSKQYHKFICEVLEKLDDIVSKKKGAASNVKPIIKRNLVESQMTLLDTAKIGQSADISGIENFRATDFSVIEGKVQSNNVVLATCSSLSKTGVINCEDLKVYPDVIIKGHIYTEFCRPALLVKYPENIHIMPKGWFKLMQKPAV